MWAELERLKERWAKKPGVKGGIHALAGFNFQLAASLLALVRTPPGERSEGVLIEGLSDLVSSEGGYLVICQAKLTLGHASLRDALNELWEIDQLARVEVPNLAPHLRYRILSASTRMKDAAAALRTWRHEEWDEALAEFRQRVTLAAEADPHQLLAEHLVNAFGDSNPFETAEKWLGRLLSEPTETGFRKSCRQILIELRGLEHRAAERTHRFHIWSQEDRSPSEVKFEADPQKATLVGQLPHRRDLTEGRFAPRWFYNGLHREVEGWLADATHSGDTRIPVFWLTGRSGSGKSVALLHLLANLRQQDSTRIIVWLDSQAERLAEAAAWARPFFAEGRQVIFASDDPYSPERHQKVEAAVADFARELDAVAAAYPQAERSALIFCGPTEQATAFEEDLSDRTRLKSYPMPQESARDVQELREWYRLRTGKMDIPAGGGEDQLVVQLFFEWSTGQPIREFAQRFRQRLEAMMQKGGEYPLFDLVSNILALNRLYALYPSEPLEIIFGQNPELGVAFDLLSKTDAHFSFDPEAEGYRLTHPHLADAIYATWFGRPDHSRFRRAHLSTAIAAALSIQGTPQQRLAPLWALVRLVRTADRTPDLLDRLKLIRPELYDLLRRLYSSEFARTPNPLTDLPVWTDLDRHLDLALSPSPLSRIAAACEDAREPAPGLRLSCHKLLEFRHTAVRGKEIVAGILHRFPDWVEWPAIAIDYIARVGVDGIAQSLVEAMRRQGSRSARLALAQACIRSADPAVQGVALEWLETTPDTDLAWPFVVQEVIDAWGLDASTRDLALRHLANTETESWSHVWEALHLHSSPEDRKSLEDMARTWLAKADAKISGWDRIWEHLWKISRSDENLWLLGAACLADVPDHASWSYIWQELNRGAVREEQTKLIGRDWLEKALDHNGWTFVWCELWQESAGRWPSGMVNADDPTIASLRDVCVAWLEGNFSHASWSYIWQDLWEGGFRTSTLQDLALRWLDERRSDDSWSYVCNSLAEVLRPEQTIAALESWLDQTPFEHPGWRLAWRKLSELRGSVADARFESALTWLEEHRGSPTWSVVCQELRQARPSDDRPLNLARAWLSTTSLNNTQWPRVWRALATRPIDPWIREVGYQWLREGSQDDPFWGRVWDRLWNASGGLDDDLVEVGRKWLFDRAYGRRSWSNVWRVVVWVTTRDKLAGRPELLQLGLDWLRSPERIDTQWMVIWQPLWAERAAPREELSSIARRFNVTQPPKNKPEFAARLFRETGKAAPPEAWAWKDHWEFRWNNAAGDVQERSQLAEEAKVWLAELHLDQRGWTSVWTILWRSAEHTPPEREDLVALAFEWISRVDSAHPRWAAVWLTLWRHSETLRPSLTTCAHAWLSGPGTVCWPEVWLELWGASGRGDSGLAEVARVRLATLNPTARKRVEQELSPRGPRDLG